MRPALLLLASAMPAVLFAGCSGSGDPTSARPVSPSTATSAYSPTTPPISGISTPRPQVYQLPQSGGTVAVGTNGSAGSVTFPSNDAPPGTTVNLFEERTQSNASSGSYTEENVNFTVSNAVTFSSYGPSYSLVPPSNPTSGATLRAYFFDSTTGVVYASGNPVPACGSTVYVPAGSLGSFAVVANDDYSLNLNVDFDPPTGSSGTTPTCPP